MTGNLGPRTRKLVAAVYKRTVAGEIDWRPSDFSNTVEAEVGEMTIQVSQFTNDYDDSAEYVMFVKDKTGTVKDRIDRDMLVPPSGLSAVSAFDSDVSDKLERIYFEAKRRVSGASEAVDQLLDALGEG